MKHLFLCFSYFIYNLEEVKKNAIINELMENSSLALAERGRESSQLFERDTGHNALDDSRIDDEEERHNSQSVWRRSGRLFMRILNSALLFIMHKSTRTGLIGIAVLICAVVIILLINIVSIQPKVEDDDCLELNGTKTCYSTSSNPYHYYGTKTPYHIALGKNTEIDTEIIKDCTPKVFYLFSRHATRYPDEDSIIEMIERLPLLHEAILNSSANLCEEDIDKFRVWKETLKLEYDNKISPSGEIEAASLAQRYKARFPSILDKKYSSDKFTFEYTSRERSQTTADAFARGLFGNNFNLDGQTNDKILQFHKECKDLKNRCKDKSLDIYEVKQFEKGAVMKKLIKSVSKRLGFNVDSEDIEFMYKACAFGYSLETDDIWCAVFSTEELEVLEYGADIDDYYKDAYGNSINYEQACPVAKYIVDLFNSSANATEDRAVLHFSHAGAVKKVYAMFGLFQDENPLLAEGFCTLKNRQWRSSLIAPFNSNLAFVLFQCGSEQKVAAYLNEKAVVLGGCESELCPLADFYAKYAPIGETCDIKELCCTCCVH